VHHHEVELGPALDLQRLGQQRIAKVDLPFRGGDGLERGGLERQRRICAVRNAGG
jgi:hypothetical protein